MPSLALSVGVNPNCAKLDAICFSSARSAARSRQSKPMRNILSRSSVRSSVCSHTSITNSTSMSRRSQGDADSHTKRQSCPPAPGVPSGFFINGRCGSGTPLSTVGIGTTVNVGSLRPPGLPILRFCSTGFGGLPIAISSQDTTMPSRDHISQSDSFRRCARRDGTGGMLPSVCERNEPQRTPDGWLGWHGSAWLLVAAHGWAWLAWLEMARGLAMPNDGR